MAWGTLPILVYPSGSLAAQLFQVVVLAATTGVASSVSASHLPSFFAYTLPATIPLVVRMLAQPDIFHRVLGLMVIVSWRR
jgi:hypothetical protein